MSLIDKDTNQQKKAQVPEQLLFIYPVNNWLLQCRIEEYTICHLAINGLDHNHNITKA